MAKHRTLVGLHARNSQFFTEPDYAVVGRARIETLKVMSHVSVQVFDRLRRQYPKLEFIVRLFDDRIGRGSHPEPNGFVARMVPLINALKPYATKYEIHNEPNHADRIEGWGPGDAQARSFSNWYLTVLAALKQACPWALFGFPGLALNHPHRDMEWLTICQDAVNASDFLGCHCYWQHGNMMSEEWGLRFKLYHERFPKHRIEITEFGDSTPDLFRGEQARRYVRYYTELNKYPYLGSASAFIASSPDPRWAPFAWLKEGGEMMPVVDAVGKMERKAVEIIRVRAFPQTGKSVRGLFLDFWERLGPGVCGYPITQQFEEEGIQTQYFRRAAMEEHEPGKARLKRVGEEAWVSRARIAQLETLAATLSQEPLPSLEGVIDELSEAVASLATQIRILQDIAVRAEATASGDEEEQSELISSLRKRINALRNVSDNLHTEMAAALKAMGEEQSALIDHLRERIGILEARIDGLESQLLQLLPAPETARVRKPVINHIVDTLPKHETETYSTRTIDTIEYLVIHHSVTGPIADPELIARYHIEHWDWPGIGYHFLVSGDGTIYQTNELETVSHHAASVNPVGVGICFLGDFTEEVPSSEQLWAGAHLVAWLLQELGLDLDAARGHREFMQTSCPGDQWLTGRNWKEMLQLEITEVRRQAAIRNVPDGPKTLYHYLLLRAPRGEATEEDWDMVREYVRAFQPVVGFRATDAIKADYVTVACPSGGIPQQVDDWLTANDTKVDRITRTNRAEIKRLLDKMAEEGRRFLGIDE